MQFHNWFRLHLILYQLQNISGGATHTDDQMIETEEVFFFFKQKTAYEIGVRLVGSEMCIRDRHWFFELEAGRYLLRLPSETVMLLRFVSQEKFTILETSRNS